MNFEQIKELIELVAEHDLHGLELERSGLRLRIEGKGSGAGPVPMPGVHGVQETAPVPVAAVATVPEPSSATSVSPAEDEVPDGAHVLHSPIVGTFYAAPNPDSPSFVKVGDRVAVGDMLCIVEAMKLMNEIEADVSGTIVKIYPENSQAVEFGEPLFAIQPG